MKHMTIYNHLPPEMRLGESGANDMHIQPGLEIPATAQEVIIGQEIEIDANGTHSLRVSFTSIFQRACQGFIYFFVHDGI